MVFHWEAVERVAVNSARGGIDGSSPSRGARKSRPLLNVEGWPFVMGYFVYGFSLGSGGGHCFSLMEHHRRRESGGYPMTPVMHDCLFKATSVGG